MPGVTHDFAIHAADADAVDKVDRAALAEGVAKVGALASTWVHAS